MRRKASRSLSSRSKSTEKKFDLGLRVSYAITMKEGLTEVQNDFFVGIKAGLIVEARQYKTSDIKKCRKFLERENMVLLPGLINAHTHLAMTLLRGVEDDVPLKTWLFDRIFPLEAEFVSPQFVKIGVSLAARECIRFGTTTANDMYFYNAEAAKVWDNAGLRGIFSQAFSDFPLPEDKQLGPDREGRFRKLRRQYQNHERIEIGLGPHAPYSCSDEVLTRVAELAKETGALLHVHVSEAENEKPDSLKKFGLKPVHRLHALGVLGERTVGAHSVHLDDEEIELYRKTGTSPIYNPDSNAKLASGVAPIPKYLKAGIPVALGTDGSASANDLSLFGAMDLGTKIQKIFHKDATALGAAQILRMATCDGARALGLDHKIGSIEVGKEADLICVDLNFPHLQPLNDIVSHMVYCTQGLEVDTVICRGKILLKNKQFSQPELRKPPTGLDSQSRKIRTALKKLRA